MSFTPNERSLIMLEHTHPRLCSVSTLQSLEKHYQMANKFELGTKNRKRKATYAGLKYQVVHHED